MVSWFDNKGVELHQEQLKLSLKKKKKTPHFSKLKKDNVCSQVSDLASQKKKEKKKGQRMHETRQTQSYKLTRERYHGKAFTTLTI